jgi:nitroreductase/NAD-dependent dihydropyrimidine dehydrogenase PreA subunit
MEHPITFQRETCKACGLCAQVCPNKIMFITKTGPATVSLRPDRLSTCFKCGQCMAVCPTQSIVVEGLSYAGDFFELPPSPDGQSFFDLIARRRAVRNLEDRPVPRELLEKVVEAIAFAPPGFPPIKTELVVVQDTAVIRQALPHMIDLYDFLVRAMQHPIKRLFVRRSAGAEKFHVLETHLVPLLIKRLPELKQGTEDTLTRGAPALIIFHGHRAAENFRADAYIALTYGFLAAHALGLGASAMDIIPPAIEKSRALRQLFSIPDTHEVVAAMILGYPQYRYQRGIKRSLKRVQWI